MAKTKLLAKNPVLKGGNHYVTCGFGYYSDGKTFHKGIDLVASSIAGEGGDDIIAFDDGKVVNCCNSIEGTNNDTGTKGMGNYVILEHSDGSRTRYMHMVKGSVKVKKGATVKKGQVLGTMGNTGYSTGRHLHFDISVLDRKTGAYYSGGRYYLDPAPFLKGTEVTDANKTGKTYVVNVKSSLNVRKGPGKEYDVVKKLLPGTKVNIIDVKDEWGEIATNQWVMMEYLK